jgi:hypothetical protein
MSKIIRLFLSLFLLIGFNQLSLVLGQNNQNPSPGKITGQTIGFEVVFVLDISPNFPGYLVDLHQIVNSAYEIFEKYTENKNTYHLITFNSSVELPEVDNTILIEELKEKFRWMINSNRCINYEATYPEDALNKVFHFYNEKFPQKVGIVLFIYNTARVNRPDDLQQTIRILKSSIEMNVFRYLFHTQESENDIRQKIEEIAAKALEIEFASPVKRNEFNALKTENLTLREETETLKNQLKNQEGNLETRVKLLEGSERELKVMRDRRDKKINTLNSVLFTSFVVFIVVLIILIKDKMPFFQYKRKILWGKLIPLDDDNRKPLDLSQKPSKGIVETASRLSNLKLFQDCRHGKRVIAIQADFGRVECLDKNKVACRNNQYIDERTRFIKLSDPAEGKNFTFKYRFLDEIEDCYETPVEGPPKFKGRLKIIKEIKKNFLGVPKYRFHYIISGIGNSGKTSLMLHLYKKIFNEDEMVKQYEAVLIQDDKEKYIDFNSFGTYLKNEIKGMNSGERKLIILIDDYDKISDRFEEGDLEKFKDLVRYYHKELDYFFIISGQKVFSPKYANHLPDHTHKIALIGIDNFNPAKEENGYDMECALDLIDSILVKVGLSRNHLSKAVKKEIVKYSNGIPYFIMRILYEMLDIWLDDYNIYSIRKRNVEEAASKVANSSDYAMIERICSWEMKNKDKAFLDGVSIPDVLNKISVYGKGKIKKRRLMGKLGFIHREKNETEEEHFDKIVEQLKETGLIAEEGENIIGIPYLFYFKGGTVIDDTTNN